jgi:hypothetical protein
MRPTRQSSGSADASGLSLPGLPASPSASATRGRAPAWRTLWLPLSAPAPTWLATALLAVIYLATMSRDLSFYDSAELALAAVQGGLSHPPGHPLYVMLGWLFAHVPGIPPLLGLNALSVIPAALALVPVASLAESMAGAAASGGTTAGARGRVARHALPALLVILALHAALWEVASRIEVYALATFFALWAVARAAALLAGPAGPAGTTDAADAGGAAGSAGRERALPWLGPGLALGLCASVNPVIAMVAALSLAPALIAALIRDRGRWRQGLALVAGGLAGCLPYLYVPLVAGRRDVFVWGMPEGGEALRRFVTFADFSTKQTGSPAAIAQHALEWLPWAMEHGLLPLLALGLVAHLAWGPRARIGRALAPLSLGLTLIFIWRNAVYYPGVPDYLGYLMAPLWLLGAGVAAVLVRLSRIHEPDARPRGRSRALAGLLAGALVLTVALTPPPLHGRTRHRDDAARALARGALEHAPPRAVIIAGSDHWVFPMMYLQEAEGVRPDVVVLVRGLSGSSWFWQHLLDRHADLRPFALRGPGGQPARIARFLAENPGRPVLYEDWAQALSLGHRPACVGPWLAGDERACAAGDAAGSSTGRDELTPALERMLDTLGEGSPVTDEVIARAAQDRGEALWRLGRPDEALAALRAGIPPAHRPQMSTSMSTPMSSSLSGGRLSGVPPLEGPLPAWRDRVPLGHHARNLYLAAVLLAQAGLEQEAASHLGAAAAAGLAEALSP